jgi:hypothetical protein
MGAIALCEARFPARQAQVEGKLCGHFCCDLLLIIQAVYVDGPVARRRRNVPVQHVWQPWEIVSGKVSYQRCTPEGLPPFRLTPVRPCHDTPRLPSIVPRIRISNFLLVWLDSDKNRLSTSHSLYVMTMSRRSSFIPTVLTAPPLHGAEKPPPQRKAGSSVFAWKHDGQNAVRFALVGGIVRPSRQ